MSYSIFYSIEAIGRDVASDNPESCSGEDTYLELLSALNIGGDFFGLVDSNEVCLQVLYEIEKDRYWVEIPRPDLGGSYGINCSSEAVEKILKTLPEILPIEGLPGFEFKPW